MGVLKADQSKVVLVSPGEHVIQATTTVEPTTLRTQVEVDQVEKTVELAFKDEVESQRRTQEGEAPRVRAGAALSPTWTDPATGLMWTRKDNGTDVNWEQANSYCSKLQLAGLKDWRLPTIDELQGIYAPGVSFRVRFDNGLLYDVHVRGHLVLTGSHWSSSDANAPGESWQADFGSAEPRVATARGNGELRMASPRSFYFDTRALCVRRAGLLH